MTALPWQSFNDTDPADEYLVMASRLQLRRYWSIPGFFRLAGTVRQQLSGTDGLVGYSLFTQVPHRTFFTLSAWRNQDALDGFVRTSPHREVMATLRPRMMSAVFTSWQVSGSALPVSWPDAKRRLATEASSQGHEG